MGWLANKGLAEGGMILSLIVDYATISRLCQTNTT